ncbi:MAG: hypothetical protein ACFFDH_25965 [Promethearchaeota archaeon]
MKKLRDVMEFRKIFLPSKIATKHNKEDVKIVVAMKVENPIEKNHEITAWKIFIIKHITPIN